MREHELVPPTTAPLCEGGRTRRDWRSLYPTEPLARLVSWLGVHSIRPLAAAATAAFLICTCAGAIAVNSSLYADGAYYLLEIISKKGFLFVWWDRSGTNFLTQAPLILGMHAGIHSMQAAVLLYSLGVLGVPAFIYLMVLVFSRGEWYLPVICAVILAIYASTFFMSSSESVTAYSIYLLMAVILASSSKLNYARTTVLILCAIIIPFLYETSLLFGPLLALWSVYRFRNGHDPSFARGLLYAPVIAGLAAAVTSAAAIAHPVSSQNEQGAGNLSGVFSSHEFDAACVVIVGGLALAVAVRRPLVIASGEAVALGIATLLTSIGSALPITQYTIRLAPTALLVSVFGLLWKQTLRNTIDLKIVATSRRMGCVVVALVVALAIQNVMLLSGWQNFFNSLRREVNNAHGLVPYSDAKLQLAGEYGWSWTYPTMSRIIQSSPRQALIENPDPSHWQPFDPSRGAPSAGNLYWRR